MVTDGLLGTRGDQATTERTPRASSAHQPQPLWRAFAQAITRPYSSARYHMTRRDTAWYGMDSGVGRTPKQLTLNKKCVLSPSFMKLR